MLAKSNNEMRLILPNTKIDTIAELGTNIVEKSRNLKITSYVCMHM